MSIHDRATESPMAVYRRHLAHGELAYQFSVAANKPVFYPRIVCPYTGSGQLELAAVAAWVTRALSARG